MKPENLGFLFETKYKSNIDIIIVDEMLMGYRYHDSNILSILSAPKSKGCNIAIEGIMSIDDKRNKIRLATLDDFDDFHIDEKNYWHDLKYNFIRWRKCF